VNDRLTILQGDCLDVLRTLPSESVHCCVSSPPYWGLRDYGVVGQIGLEATPQEYVSKMVEVFAEVRRVLRSDGTCWVNLGSSYWGSGRGGNPEESEFRKQATNAGSLIKPMDWKAASSYGKRPIQSHSDAPSCGTNGKAPQDSPWSDHACPDCGGELIACSPIRRGRSAHISQPHEQSEQRLLPKVHDSEHRDSDSSSPDASGIAAHQSTISSWCQNAPVVPSQVNAVLELQQESQTLSDSAQESEGRVSCTSCIEQIDRPSVLHKSDKVCVCMACGYSTKTLPNFKPKDMVPIPWMVAMALQTDGWYLRSDIIWHKLNPMPESVTDRPTKSHEYLFLLSKAEHYHYDAEAIKEPCSESTHMRISQDLANQVGSFLANGGNKTNGPMKAVIAGSTRKLADAGTGIAANRSYESALALPVGSRNRRSVWSVSTEAYSGAHFATFPSGLIKPCILAGCPVGGTCLDPFGGSGTTGMVALELGRKAILIELNPAYVEMQKQRCNITPGLAIA
jgi:DNA modification methylase